MEKVFATRPSWLPSPLAKTLAGLLPLWLVSIAISTEGFPSPPVPAGLAFASFVIAIVAVLGMLLTGWIKPVLALYSFLPLILLFTFDEIYTTYKTPFILLCALILTAGALAHQLTDSYRPSVLVLIAAAVLTLFLASNAAGNFWAMVEDLGYGRCYPNCPALTGADPPGGPSSSPFDTAC